MTQMLSGELGNGLVIMNPGIRDRISSCQGVSTPEVPCAFLKDADQSDFLASTSASAGDLPGFYESPLRLGAAPTRWRLDWSSVRRFLSIVSLMADNREPCGVHWGRLVSRRKCTGSKFFVEEPPRRQERRRRMIVDGGGFIGLKISDSRCH